MRGLFVTDLLARQLQRLNPGVVDEEAAQDEEITLVVQVNGKLRDRIQVPVGISDAEAEQKALSSPAVQQALAGKQVRKVIVVPGKLVNFVV